MIVRRREWMAATAIFTGQIPIIGEGLNEVIDFGFDNVETIVTDALKWSAPTSHPLEDIERWRKKVQKTGFVNCNLHRDHSEAGAGYLRIQRMVFGRLDQPRRSGRIPACP